MPASERSREIKRRRHRRARLLQLRARLKKATQSEREEITRKLRELTPGAEVLIKSWELADAKS